MRWYTFVVLGMFLMNVENHVDTRKLLIPPRDVHPMEEQPRLTVHVCDSWIAVAV